MAHRYFHSNGKCFYLLCIITFLAIGFPAYCLGADPVSWYRLDESSGTVAADSSGNGHNGTLINGSAVGINWLPGWGRIGGAANFDGDGPANNINPYCRVEVTTAGMSNNNGTIAFWANITDPAPVDKNNRAGLVYFFGLNPNISCPFRFWPALLPDCRVLGIKCPQRPSAGPPPGILRLRPCIPFKITDQNSL